MSEIAITIEQLDNMKHAIGYKRDTVKRGKYTAYRNYFATSVADEHWERLCEKGCAFSQNGKKYVFYHLTEKGFELLEMILDIRIERG